MTARRGEDLVTVDLATHVDVAPLAAAPVRALGDHVGQGTEALQFAHDGVGIALLGGEQVTTPHADRVDAARTGT